MSKPCIAINNWSLGFQNPNDFFQKHDEDDLVYLFGIVLRADGKEQKNHVSTEILRMEDFLKRFFETEDTVYLLGTIKKDFLEGISKMTSDEERLSFYRSFKVSEEAEYV